MWTRRRFPAINRGDKLRQILPIGLSTGVAGRVEEFT